MNKAILTILLCSLPFLEGRAKKVYDLKWNIKEQEEVLYDLTIQTSSLKSDVDSTKSVSREDSSSMSPEQKALKALQAIGGDVAKYLSSDIENAKQGISFSSTSPDIIDVKILMYNEAKNAKELQNSLLDMFYGLMSTKDSVSAEDEALIKYIKTRDESLLKDVSEEHKSEAKALIQQIDESKKIMEEMKQNPTIRFRGSVYENGAIHSFWTKQNQKNLLAAFAQLPTDKVAVGDSWSLDVNLIICNENVIWKKSFRKNSVTLENIIVENGETIAVLNYDIVESFQGENDLDNINRQIGGFNPFSGMYSKDINIEVSMIGKGYFSITKGRWKKYSIDITNKNANTTTVQTYSFQEK